MKITVLLFLFALAGCEDEQARAEKLRQQAIEREVEARVKARTAATAGDTAINPLRVLVFGVIASGGVMLLHFLGAPRGAPGDESSDHPENRPPRSGGRFLDLHHHENPPRR